LVLFTPDTDNTGACSLQADATAAKAIKIMSGGVATDPDDGDLQAGIPYMLVYGAADTCWWLVSTYRTPAS